MKRRIFLKLIPLIIRILIKVIFLKKSLKNQISIFAETAGLTELHPVEMLQDQAQCILGDYVRNRYARQPTRFGRLLLAIPLLRMIRASTVETVFFRDTVGETSVIRLLHDMYNADRQTTN